MATTYINFVECKLTKGWFPEFFAHTFDPTKNTVFNSHSDDAEIGMVDIQGNRRYFSFKQKSKVFIVGNVFVYDSNDAEELAIDESKQFPKKTRMDE